VKKIGELTIKFQKDEYRERLKYEIRTSKDAYRFGISRGLPKELLEEQKWHTQGLKTALRLLEELDHRDDDDEDDDE
jgi:hypothetical protein